MSGDGRPPGAVLRQLTTAYWTSQVVYVTAKLGIPDLLTTGGRGSDELAAATGTHSPSLYRLLRAAASLGLFTEDADRRFSLTVLGAALRSDAPGSMRGWAVLLSEPWFRSGWDNLLYSVRTGKSGFAHAHGASLWDYLALNEAAAATFNEGITSVSPMKARAILETYDFSRFGTVVDVGGGQGSLMAAILAAHPAIRGILFDLPRVVESAPPVLKGAGVDDRCRVIGGDFFASVPVGGDVYVLATIIHDFDDDLAATILRICHRAMTAGTRLVLIEEVIPAGDTYHPSKFDDLNMLVTLHGRERTADEFRTLFETSGFVLNRILPTPSQWNVIEGVRD